MLIIIIKNYIIGWEISNSLGKVLLKYVLRVKSRLDIII